MEVGKIMGKWKSDLQKHYLQNQGGQLEFLLRKWNLNNKSQELKEGKQKKLNQQMKNHEDAQKKKKKNQKQKEKCVHKKTHL